MPSQSKGNITNEVTMGDGSDVQVDEATGNQSRRKSSKIPPKPVRELWKPILYTEMHAGLKYKKMCCIAHKRKILDDLRDRDIPAWKKQLLAKHMSYYPGVGRHRPIVPNVFEFN